MGMMSQGTLTTRPRETDPAESGKVQDIKRRHTIADLNTMYSEGDSADQYVFAEMRSNLLLVAGEHYQKKESITLRRIRDNRELSQEQKLRLTKNHIRKICQTYVNNILAPNPGVGFTPKNEKDMHDEKVAEMHHAVWRDAFERYEIDDLIDDWADNFVQIGEVSVKIFWDPNTGEIKGYAPLMDAMGQPSFDEMGQPAPDMDQPLYSGGFVFEEVYGFNLLRPTDCRDIKKAEWLGIRKMVNKEELLLRFTDPKLKIFIQESVEDTYMVFDAAYGGYHKAKNQVSVREYFFRPCMKYPRGYFYISTKGGILAEGELPGGVFPIVVQVFDKIQTTPRGRGPVKQMRPFQAEINRSASKIAEHQVTLGDDKLLVQNGTKVSAAASLPGIRAYSYTGKQPEILEGRSGAQYFEYSSAIITEMYSVMNVAEDSEASTAEMDPYVLLFRSARQKKKFQRYIKRFEKFLVGVVKTYLRLAKIHLDDEALVYAVGSSERVNIPEFKKLSDLCYEVKVEAQSDDIETKLGKQIVLNHTLQYVGNQLKPEDIGKVMREMPFANFDGTFDDMTINYDNATNDILALDRGEQPPVGQYDEHPYNIKRLTSRMRKADYRYLPPQVQANYQSKVDLHQQMEAFRLEQIQRAEAGFIPTDGFLVGVDFYVPDAADPTGGKTRRAKLPQSALGWLIKQLELQGQGQQELENLNEGAQAQIAEKMTGGGGPGGNPGGQPPQHPPMHAGQGIPAFRGMMPNAMGRGA